MHTTDSKHTTMKATPTPGPWFYDLNHTVGTQLDGEWMESVCQLPAGARERIPTSQEKADMQLVAAAPELLESLSELSEWMRAHTGPADGTHEMLCRAYLVIIKATHE